MKLSSIIFENRFDQQAKKLEGELRDAHNQDNIVVSMGYFSEDGPKASKGFGKVTFRQKEEVDPSDWKNLKNFLQAKGLEVESESNYYDNDGDRHFFPHVKFEFNI